jgi:hypothetical protein
MPRSSTASAQVQALRTLADEIEAGTREKLSPSMAKALDRELARDDDGEHEELTQEEWEEAWAKEIDLRLADYRAGKAKKVDLGVVLDDLRSRLR